MSESKHFEPPTYADALAEIERLRAELAEYRAMFCPEGCEHKAPSASVIPTGLDCRKHVARLRHLDTPEGRVVMKCQECFDGKGDNE